MACLHESQVLAFVAGEETGREQIEQHIDDCTTCRKLISELVRRDVPVAIDDTVPATDRGQPAAPMDTEWQPGTRVGRYVVLARIGRGGMGTVYRAEDVELARPVALKRLHADADAESRARLVREARAAAQLQHPNVVTVHEVGEHAGTPYLAMELVDGVTLTAWVKERTREWREIVDVVAQAGRGLAAAHARGLVHRDFKPDNVLVDRSGRARVADFGLARAVDAVSSTPSSSVGVDTRLTVTGSLAGTPAYIAPELVEGAPADAKSDQYAFAITLWEALRGQHPFAGETAARLWVEMAEGRIRNGGLPVPAWLDKHARRGLEVDPAQRWPDVAAFVAAITKPPHRRVLWIASGAAVVAGTAAVLVLGVGASGVGCDELAAEYTLTASLDAIDPAQRARAREKIEWFTQDVRKALRDSCRATRGGTQSAAIGDKRTACIELAKRRAWFATRDVTNVAALDALPDVSACSDPEWLERAAPLPIAQADRDALYAAEEELVRAGTLRDDGKLAEAAQLVERVNTTAKRLGDRSLDARASLFAAEIARDRGDLQQASLDAMEAWSAASAHGDGELTLRAQLAMLRAQASDNKRAVDGFAGLGEVPETPNGARLITAYADTLMAAGRFAEGEQQYRRAHAIYEATLPAGHVERALAAQRIGAALAVQKRAADALPYLTQAHEQIEKVFPPLRREAIDGVRYLAMAEEERGNIERAVALWREVLARRAKVHGDAHGMTLDARHDLADALSNAGNTEEAVRELQAVAAGFDALGARSVNAADVRVTLANNLITLDRFADAERELAAAIPVVARARGADSPHALAAELALVRAYVERPQPVKLAEATRMLDRIEPVFAKLFGASSQPVAVVLFQRAHVARAKRDRARAHELASAAIAMLGDDRRTDRAEVSLFDAEVLFALGQRDEAIALAVRAAQDYGAAGPGFADEAASARDAVARYRSGRGARAPRRDHHRRRAGRSGAPSRTDRRRR